jgi:hypothetical protein
MVLYLEDSISRTALFRGETSREVSDAARLRDTDGRRSTVGPSPAGTRRTRDA